VTRCCALLCLVGMPGLGCLLLVDRPTASESDEQDMVMPMPEDDDDDDGESGCIDHVLPTGALGVPVYSGTTRGAGDDLGGCGGSADVILSWTAPSSGTYRFTVQSDYDSVIGLYRASCAGAPLECNDDCDGVDGAVEYFASEGEELLIVVDGFDGDRGDFDLLIDRGFLECGSGGTSTTW
jgi:hypothetical protein